MRRYTKSIEVNDTEKIDNQESKDMNIKIDETISNTNNPSLPQLDDEKENHKLEYDNLMYYNNLEKKNDDDEDEDEYFKQPLMRVHRISIHSKDLGKLRRKLSIQNEKEKEKEVSIDKDLALKAALNYFGKRLKSFHGSRLNSERNRRNNSHSDYFNKNKSFNKKLVSNRTRPNLTLFKEDKENEENEEKNNRKDEEIIKEEIKEMKEKKENEGKKEEEIKNKDENEEENDYDKKDEKNDEKRNEKNEDNRMEEENKYTKKFRVMVNRKKYREKNNISHEEKEENSIDYHRKKNRKNDEEKEYLNISERKNYKNIGRRKFIINNSPRSKNEENEEIKNIINQRGKQNIIYKKKEISNYYKEREKEKEKKQNIKEILNENNSQNPIRVRRYQRILVGDGIDNNKNNEKRKEREVQKERKRGIEKLIQTPEKAGHSFYRRYRINNDNKDKDKDSRHNISYRANVGLTSPNYSSSMIKNPIKLTNKVTNQIPLHKISVNNTNNHRSKLISETPKEKERISYTGYLRKILNDKNNLGNKEKDNKRIGVIKRGALQINTNYSNSFIRSNVNKREEKLFENKYNRHNATSKDKKYEINHTINYINTEGNIRVNNRKNIFDKKQNINIKNNYKNDYKNDYKNANKNVNKNINQNVNKNVAKYVDRRNNNNNNLNNGFSTISVSTVNRRRILIGKK